MRPWRFDGAGAILQAEADPSMSPRPLALLLALLLGARLAGACPACSAPAPGPEARPDPAPAATFMPAAPGALTPDEARWLAATQQGRYELRAAAVIDRRAPEPDRHALTNAQAQALLGARARERVALLRERVENGPLAPPLHAEAVSLFWLRGPLLPKSDQDFLRELITPQYGRAPPQPGQGPGGVPAGQPGGGQPPGAADVDALLGRLLTRVQLDDHGDPRQGAGLRAGLRNMLLSQTGREMAEQFIAEGATAKLSFEAIPGSRVVEENGRRVLQSSGGHALTHLRPVQVVLNRDYLDTDPDYQRVNVAGTLAHELFGHAFERQRADRARVTDSLMNYRGDEAGSGLLGWLVQLELGGPADDGHMWSYAQDPERYHKELQTNLPYYATTFSPAEMPNPADTLAARRGQVEEERRRARMLVASTLRWRPVARHFIDAHGMAEPPFGTVFETLRNYEVWLASHETNLTEIGEHMDRTRAWWTGTPEGRAARDRVVNESRRPYFQQMETRLRERRERLNGLLQGRRPEPSTPPIPGHVQLPELYRMYDEDVRDNPGHWEPGPDRPRTPR